jgi:hypothetical protein
MEYVIQTRAAEATAAAEVAAETAAAEVEAAAAIFEAAAANHKCGCSGCEVAAELGVICAVEGCDSINCQRHPTAVAPETAKAVSEEAAVAGQKPKDAATGKGDKGKKPKADTPTPATSRRKPRGGDKPKLA